MFFLHRVAKWCLTAFASSPRTSRTRDPNSFGPPRAQKHTRAESTARDNETPASIPALNYGNIQVKLCDFGSCTRRDRTFTTAPSCVRLRASVNRMLQQRVRCGRMSNHRKTSTRMAAVCGGTPWFCIFSARYVCESLCIATDSIRAASFSESHRE